MTQTQEVVTTTPQALMIMVLHHLMILAHTLLNQVMAATASVEIPQEAQATATAPMVALEALMTTSTTITAIAMGISTMTSTTRCTQKLSLLTMLIKYHNN